MKIKKLCYLLFVFAFVFASGFSLSFLTTPCEVYAETQTVLNNSTVNKKTYNVLVLYENPSLPSLGTNKKASDFFAQRKSTFSLYRDCNTVVNEYVQYINKVSHGNVQFNIVETIENNELPYYNKLLKLNNGTYSYQIDEASWLNHFSNGYSYESTKFGSENDLDFGDFNSEYLLTKYNLVEKRNNGDFDVVLLVNFGELYCFESQIVGRSAYWDNGTEITKECDNFLILATTLTRSETYLECLGHSSEFTLQRVYHDDYGSSLNLRNNYSLANLDEMSPWQKFQMIETTTNNGVNIGSGKSAVGNIHFAPNSSADYEWSNTNYVQSSYYDWLNNYPNLTGATTSINANAWIDANVYGGGTDLGSNNLAHKIWWLSCLPHVSGRDSYGGYSNNWWDYIFGLDYASSISNQKSTYNFVIGQKINTIKYNISYVSGKTAIYALDKTSANISISGESVGVNSNGELYAKSEGTSIITTKFEGKTITTTVNVVNFNILVNYDYNGGTSNPVSLELNCNSSFTTLSSENITKENYELAGWKVIGLNKNLTLELNKNYDIIDFVEFFDEDFINDKTITLSAIWKTKQQTTELNIDVEYLILGVFGFIMIASVVVINNKWRKNNE